LIRELSHTYGYEDRPEIVEVMTFCACGTGEQALVIRLWGYDTMIGCSCHHEAIVYREGLYWKVMVFDLVEEEQ